MLGQLLRGGVAVHLRAAVARPHHQPRAAGAGMAECRWFKQPAAACTKPPMPSRDQSIASLSSQDARHMPTRPLFT
jgi:hypothetical protein